MTTAAGAERTVIGAGRGNGTDDVIARPLRHPGRWVAALVVVGFALLIVTSVWSNQNIAHPVITQYLFDPRILQGVVLTIALTASGMVLATVLATVLAVMRLSPNPVLRTTAWVYVWFFRGTPLLVQIVFWGYLGLLYTQISVGVPLTSLQFWSAPTSAVITPFIAGLLALGLNEAAYASEIVRAGLLSVDPGHVEAAYSLGMSPSYTLRRIILPQAMRVIIPPMGNETISMLKNTALLELIAVQELYTRASDISAQNLRQVELLVVVSAWYLFLTSVLSVPQYYLERRFGRGVGRALPPTPWQRTLGVLERLRSAVPEAVAPDTDSIATSPHRAGGSNNEH